MAREDNLKANSERTPEERKELARKAGKASGKARRKKADLKKALEIILQSEVLDLELKEKLENMGYEANNEMLLAFSIFQKAANGNQRAVENIIKLTNSKDKYDIEEQKARTELVRQRSEREKLMLPTDNKEDIIIDIGDWDGD